MSLLRSQRSFEEKRFLETIDHGVKLISQSQKSDIENESFVSHFIYCSNWHYVNEKDFKKLFLKKMKKYDIHASILTILLMQRNYLITKEKQKLAYDGKLKNEREWRHYEGSVNDDLESFITKIQNNKELKNEEVQSFFTPKLTNKELKLVDDKDENHLASYFYHRMKWDHDVHADEMKKSNSKDKYLHCYCWRRTSSLNLENYLNSSEDEDSEQMNEPKGSMNRWIKMLNCRNQSQRGRNNQRKRTRDKNIHQSQGDEFRIKRQRTSFRIVKGKV